MERDDEQIFDYIIFELLLLCRFDFGMNEKYDKNIEQRAKSKVNNNNNNINNKYSSIDSKESKDNINISIMCKK